VIDFRYHVVSIVAVFLALATGLVLGASLLNTPLIKGLDSANETLIADKEELRDQLTDAQAQRDALGASVLALEPFALRDQLAGQQVVMIQLPGADDGITTGVSEAVAEAGGQVTGVVTVRDEWTAPGDQTVLDELVSRLAQPEVDFIPGDDSYGRAATLLANALVAESDPTDPGTPAESGATPPPTTVVDDEGRVTILEGLSRGGFIEADTAIARADLAVVIAPPAPSEPDEQTPISNAAWADISAALDEIGRATVLIGSAEAAGENGVIAALRADETAAANVSTVDSVDDPIGPAAAVLSLSRQLSGTNGHYGVVDAADGPVPPFAASVEG